MQNPPSTKSTQPQKSKPKSRLSKRQRQRRRNKQKLLINNQNKTPSHSHLPSRRSSLQVQNGADVWRKAYENAVRWHGEHQSNFWRHAAENLQRENQMLRQQLISTHATNSKQDYYGTSGSDDDEAKKETIPIKEEETQRENDAIDVQYLEFLKITFKHREEMRLKRQAEELEPLDIPPDLPEKIT